MLHWSSALKVLLVTNDPRGLDESLWDAKSALIFSGRLVTWPPCIADRACSKKRTCTTTLNGSNSFCAAWVQASIDNFLQSRTRHRSFLSVLLSSRCPWMFTHTINSVLNHAVYKFVVLQYSCAPSRHETLVNSYCQIKIN